MGTSAFHPLRTLGFMWHALLMKSVCVTLAALSLTSCLSPEDRAREKLLDGIEQAIRLPAGAKPLDSYARYYAPSSPDEVTGILILPGLDELAPGVGCEELGENATSAPCSFEWPKSSAVGAGNRVWLSDYTKLPMPMRDTGNCGLISVVYQSSQRRFVEVACFGQEVDH